MPEVTGSIPTVYMVEVTRGLDNTLVCGKDSHVRAAVAVRPAEAVRPVEAVVRLRAVVVGGV